MAGASSNNALTQSFEKINQASGGVVGQVVDTAKDAVTETVKDIAGSPLDILQSLIGGDSDSESTTSGFDPANPQAGQQSEFTKKLEEDRKKKEALLRQHRTVLAQYDQAFRQRQAQEEQMKHMHEEQEEQQKEQQKVIEQKKKQDPRWMQALKQGMGSSKGETGKGVH